MNDIAESSCPYCGEPVELFIDPGGEVRQEYVEDCPVCCQPWQVLTEQDESGGWIVTLMTIDG